MDPASDVFKNSRRFTLRLSFRLIGGLKGAGKLPIAWGQSAGYLRFVRFRILSLGSLD